MSRALRVAVLGAGTVGREVVRALVERGDELTAADGVPLELAGVAVRDLHRARARGLSAALLSDAPAHLVADPEIDIIVELMGGDEPAHTLIAAALAAGKAVVTANKHVIAHHGAEPRGHRSPNRGRTAVRGGRRRGHPRPRAARHGACRKPGHVGTRDRQRDDELHPQRDGSGGPGVRRGARRRPGCRLRRVGPDRRCRGPRRREQAHHPRPAGIRRLARSRRRRPPRARRTRPRLPGDHRRHLERHGRGADPPARS